MSSILIVDDEEEIVTFFATVLEEEGFDVRGAGGAMDALLQIQKEKPQVILLDLMMPQVNGEELCRIIKNDPNLFDIHIIMLSARSDVESKVSCFDSGADEYLVKPISTRELVARMRSFFRLLGGLRPRSRSGELKGVTLDMSPEGSPRIRPQYGNYRVESLVGSGGMGHVFKGYDSLLDRPVALKVLPKALSNSPRFVERFRQEAKILASTDHPGIASIYAFGEEQGDFYFAMQWCAGGSVLDLLLKKQRLELLTSIDIALQCVDALSAAFANGIVHRDIKPSNLMFDQTQRLKIVDFGLAKAERIANNITQASELFGTPDYMAPEQAQFGVVDNRADIYSLGITLYQMLYGKLPFEARSPIEMVVRHASEPFPDYDPMDGAVPREAYEIIEKMTQKSPDDRYQDYAGCRKDLLRLRDEIYSSTGVALPRLVNVANASAFLSHDYPELLCRLCSTPAMGLLTIRSGPGMNSLRFFVENKHVLFFDSPTIEEQIWRLLVEKNLIAKEDAPPPGSDFQQCLMRFLIQQAFGLEDLRKIHALFLKSVLLDAGLWKHFEGEFFEGSVVNDDIGGVLIGDVLLDLARDIMPFEEVQKALPEGQLLMRTAEFEQILPSLSLTPEESFIASRLDEGQSLSVESLCMMTGFPEEKVKRFVYVVTKLGACRFKSAAEKPSRPAKGSEGPELGAEHYARIAEQFYDLGKKEHEQGHYWKVTELCKQAIHNDPNQAKYYHLMGMAFAHHPRFLADAEQCFRKAIELESDIAEYHLALARFLFRQGAAENAIEECNQAIEIEPENEDAQNLLRMLTSKSD